MALIQIGKADSLEFRIYDSRRAMGEAAAQDVTDAVMSVLANKEICNMIFAAAPSQMEMLEALAGKDLPWGRIRAFHMDEYAGLDGNAPQGFGNFLRAALFDKCPFGRVEYICGTADDLEAECRRYGLLLKQNPADIVCMGIGENGHLAFNDPHVADFTDELSVKLVTLDETCRTQQVHDGCFASLEEVPRQALTLTIPVLTRPKRLFCVVPGHTKARAVSDAVRGPISENCPASILRRCGNAVLYLDPPSAEHLMGNG